MRISDCSSVVFSSDLMLGNWWFLIVNQGWEYLELGRILQVLLIVGLFAWFCILLYLARPSQITDVKARPIVKVFLCAALAIPVFYIPALFFGSRTHFTVVDTRSEEHTSELQSLMRISYAVFCLKKKNQHENT